jgi:hypothetical protein
MLESKFAVTLLNAVVFGSLLAACSATSEEVDETEQAALNCPPGSTEMADFCRNWGQLPGGSVQMDIGTGALETIQYKLIGYLNPTVYTQGDIIIGDKNSVDQVARAGGQTGPTEGVARVSRTGRWPNGHIAYDIDANLQNPQRVATAIAHWEEKTSLRFHARTAADTDYIHFQNGAGCSSYVGRIGGSQPVNLNVGCSVGNAIHEIGHSIGLWHEQSRTDRDDYVTVDMTNVLAGYENNFEIITNVGVENSDLALYNYGSLMHYPTNAFAKDTSKPTISVKPGHTLRPGTVIGQRNGLTDGDIVAATLLYCDEPDFPCVIPVTPYL